MKGCRSLTDSEIESVKQSLKNTRDYTLFILGIFTGFRIQELLSLKVKDVYQYGKVTSHCTVTRANMKGSHSSRTVVLHSEAQLNVLKLINEYSLEHEDYLFQSRKGMNQPITRYRAWSILKAAYRACKLQGKVACHSTRKSYSRRFYDASGQSLIKTQRALGHSNISSTVSYLSVDDEEIDNIILNLK